MQDAPQQNDQTAPQSEPLDEQALDHVAGGVDGDCIGGGDAGIIDGGCTMPYPFDPIKDWTDR